MNQTKIEIIPDDMICSCPKEDFKVPVKVATICSQCDHFCGLERHAPKEVLGDINKTHWVMCKFPMQRRMHKLSESIKS